MMRFESYNETRAWEIALTAIWAAGAVVLLLVFGNVIVGGVLALVAVLRGVAAWFTIREARKSR